MTQLHLNLILVDRKDLSVSSNLLHGWSQRMLVRNKYSKSGEDRIITLWYQVSFTTFSVSNSAVFLSLCAMPLFLIITIFLYRAEVTSYKQTEGMEISHSSTSQRKGEAGCIHVYKDTTPQCFPSRKWPQNVRHRPGFEQGAFGIINSLSSS
jgi:hypothetical protein